MQPMRSPAQVNARDIDPDQVFTGEVRSIQAAYPEAHEALGQWGLWNRWRFGLYPRMSRPTIYHLGPRGKLEDYADDRDLEGVEIRPQVEVKPEGRPPERFNERLAVEVDCRVHKDNFPIIWRRCLRAAYVYQVPEYQFPRQSRCGPQGFLMFFDAALYRIQGAME